MSLIKSCILPSKFLFLSKSNVFRVIFSFLSTVPQNIPWSNREKTGQNRVSPEEYQENLMTMTSFMKEQNGTVIFLALASQEEIEQGLIDEKGEQYRKIMKDISSKGNYPIIDAKDIWKNKQGLFADFLHPNAKGHQLLGEALRKNLPH